MRLSGRGEHPAGAARRAESRRCWRQDQPRGHDRLVRRREGRNSKPRDYPGSLPLEATLRNCRRILRQSSGGAAVALGKVQSVDQRMRLECGVGFRQLRTCRRTRPGELCATRRHMQRSKTAVYSITSSARASSVGGTVRPSMLRGLGIDDQLELGRLHDRQVRGLGALEDATGIDARPGDTHPQCWFRSSSARRLRQIHAMHISRGSRGATPGGSSWTRRLLKKGSPPTKSASGRSRTRVAKAASISRLVLALKTWICSPMARAAASTSLNVVSVVVHWPG